MRYGLQEKNELLSTPVLLPLDWGIAFARARKWVLFSLAFFPLSAELAARYLTYTRPLSRENLYILWFLVSIADVWLVSMALMLAIEHLRGSKAKGGKHQVDLGELSNRALRHLLKPYLSYMLTSLIVSIGVSPRYFIPAIIFLLFFMWAPAFCIGESYVPRSDDDDLDDQSENEAGEKLHLRCFTHMSLWELGLGRSARLAGPSFHLSTQLALLVVVAHLGIPGLVSLTLGDRFGFTNIALQVTSAYFGHAMVIGIWAGTFLMILPVSARREIGIGEYLPPHGNEKTPWRFQGRLVPNLILFGLVILSSTYVYREQQDASQIPKGVHLEVDKMRTSASAFILQLKISDPEKNFRWLNPRNFAVAYGSQADTAKQVVAENKSGEQNTIGRYGELVKEFMKLDDLQSGPIFFPVKRVDIFDPGSLALDPENFQPAYVPLTFVLFFDYPVEFESDGAFSLYYQSLAGHGEPIFVGKFDKQQRGPSERDAKEPEKVPTP